MMSLHKERKQKGAFLVLFAVLLPVFLLLVALVSEIGRIWAYHTKLQNAADAAALAGAANFVNGDTIDSHPNADLFADRYVTANLGHNLTSSPNLQQFQAKIKAATGSEGEKSYYRVHLEEEIPLIQATAAWLHRPTFLVKATAVALIGKEGTSGGGEGRKLDKLISLGSGFDYSGSVGNNNQNKINGAVFDGDIEVWDGRHYLDMQNNRDHSYYRKFYNKEARDKGLTPQEADQLGLSHSAKWAGDNYYRQGIFWNRDLDPNSYWDNRDLQRERDKIISADKAEVEKAFTNVKEIKNDKQSYDLPQDTGSSSSYYKLTSSDSNNFTINLYNFGGNQDEPVYIYIPNDYPSINIQLHEDIVRPIIFCYFGKYPNNPWYMPSDTRTTIRFMNAYDVEYVDEKGNIKKRSAYASFRGSIYTPTAKIEPFNYEYGNFTGSLYADKIQFNSNHANFKFEEFSLPGGGGGSGTPAVKPRLVDNSLW